MLFTFDDLGGIEGVQRWRRFAGSYRSELSRVMATPYNDQMFLEDRVTNCVAALESFDRTRRNVGNQNAFLEERLREGIAFAGDPFTDLLGEESVDVWTARQEPPQHPRSPDRRLSQRHRHGRAGTRRSTPLAGYRCASCDMPVRHTRYSISLVSTATSDGSPADKGTPRSKGKVESTAGANTVTPGATSDLGAREATRALGAWRVLDADDVEYGVTALLGNKSTRARAFSFQKR